MHLFDLSQPLRDRGGIAMIDGDPLIVMGNDRPSRIRFAVGQPRETSASPTR
jgi:hypothetical protein